MNQTPSAEIIGIVFLHHDTSATAANNLQSFRDWNPNTQIVTMSAGEPFEGGYSIRDFPEHSARWNRHLVKHPEAHRNSADVLLCAWYENRREQCDRWLVVEWESFCASTVEDFLAPVAAFDFSGPSVRWLNRDPDWHWFKHVGKLPGELRPCAVGVMPFSFLLLNDAVLAAVTKHFPWDSLGNVSSELRFATVAHAYGFAPVANPLAGWNITWKPLDENTPLTEGMWHPVKWVAPPVLPKSAEPKPTPEARERIAALPVFRKPRGRNLIYTVAFDPPGKPFHQLMAKLLVSSIFRTGFDGDVLILTNAEHRVFEHGRERLEEISLDTSKMEGDLGFHAQRFKASAREFIDAGAYEKIMFVDCDCLFMDSPDRLFEGDADIAYAEEIYQTQDPPFNGYLTDEEMTALDRKGVNSGTMWVRGKYFAELMTEWERVMNLPPPRHAGWNDQPAWMRVLLDTKLRTQAFPRPGGVYYPLIERDNPAEMFAGTLWHFLSLRSAPKIPHMFGHYMRRFHAEAAFALTTMLDV